MCKISEQFQKQIPRLISGIWKQNREQIRISVLDIEIASETEAEIRFRNIETMSGTDTELCFSNMGSASGAESEIRFKIQKQNREQKTVFSF